MSDLDKFSGAEVNLNITFPTREDVYVACRHVLYVLDDDREYGQEPGGFITRIIEAATHADEMNLARLALGFPAIATAVSIFKNTPDGTAALRRLASKTPDIQPDDGFSPKGN